MTYLIVGGTGTVGRVVVRGLLDLEKSVRVVTRSQKHADSVPDRASSVVGNLEDPRTYDRIFEDADRLFLLNPVSLSELHQGLAAIHEARRVGVEHVVYLSVHDAEKALDAPHFASKIGIEAALKDSGLSHTILRPNNYYQNDLWFEEAIRTQGLYPFPIGEIGLSRVDTRDVARAAVNALTQTGHEFETYALVGPEVLTGPDCAAVYSALLGRDVTYAGDNLDAWETLARSMLPTWMAYDFRIMFSTFQEDGLVATKAQQKQTRSVLGDRPRSFQDFAKETVERWKGRSVTA